MARASRYDMAIECAFSLQHSPASAGFFLAFLILMLYICKWDDSKMSYYGSCILATYGESRSSWSADKICSLCALGFACRNLIGIGLPAVCYHIHFGICLGVANSQQKIPSKRDFLFIDGRGADGLTEYVTICRKIFWSLEKCCYLYAIL